MPHERELLRRECYDSPEHSEANSKKSRELCDHHGSGHRTTLSIASVRGQPSQGSLLEHLAHTKSFDIRCHREPEPCSAQPEPPRCNRESRCSTEWHDSSSFAGRDNNVAPQMRHRRKNSFPRPPATPAPMFSSCCTSFQRGREPRSPEIGAHRD